MNEEQSHASPEDAMPENTSTDSAPEESSEPYKSRALIQQKMDELGALCRESGHLFCALALDARSNPAHIRDVAMYGNAQMFGEPLPIEFFLAGVRNLLTALEEPFTQMQGHRPRSYAQLSNMDTNAQSGQKPASIVVLSGGQDSATTLFKAQQETHVLACVHFNYKQKHAVEGECARKLAEMCGVPLYELAVPALALLGDSALIEGGEQDDVNTPHRLLPGLPASFVPGRNLIFLTLAAALAMKIGATQVWAGLCEEDYSGYPDCRRTTADALEIAIQLGMSFPTLQIVTPLMFLSKAKTFLLAHEMGVLDIVLEDTHTCYNGDHKTRHAWGYGCDNCPACRVRKAGFEQFEQMLNGDAGDDDAQIH